MALDSLFAKSVKQCASDLHFIVGLPPFFRIDGELVEADSKAVTDKELETLVKPLLGEARFKKFLDEREMDFAYETADGSRFRINLHFEKENIGLSARAIPSTIPTMEDIGMPETVFNLCDPTPGLVLLTGPTGSGKSTSLAAMIDHVNKTRRDNIITLEDPIEFIFTPDKSIIRQRQLGTDMKSFQSGLTHALRQDPNVIMVGEMRDLETIATALTLAETGHLVFATLHTFSAAQTIDRIIDIFPPYQQDQVKTQVSITLKGIISQRLLPRQGGGRVAAREILINTPAIANLIREGKVAQIKTAIQTGAKDGMVSMDNALIKIQKEGAISKEIMDQNLSGQSQY